MPICQNCKTEFPNKINVNGKIRYLTGRKFCLQCSELDGRNTRSYIIELNDNEAFCVRCCNAKNRDDFYIRKSGKPFSYCKECQEKVKKLKLEENLERIIEERNGACADCKIPYPMPVYEFYLRGKLYHISKAKNMSLAKLKTELESHIMLCKNCCAIRKWEDE